MTSPLCDLVVCFGLWGSCVLSKLTLTEIVRLDLACLIKDKRSDLNHSYRAVCPVSLPPTLFEFKLQVAVAWLLHRNFRIGDLTLSSLSSSVQLLLANKAQSLHGKLTLRCIDDPNICTGSNLIHVSLIDKVTHIALSFEGVPSLQTSTASPRLPFRNLHCLEWYGPATDNAWLVAAIQDNSQLEALRV
jgi:hypothetical protein